MVTEDRHVSDIVRENPDLARVFEEAGINYCCGGKRPLSEACRERGLDPKTLVTVLNSLSGKRTEAAEENPDTLSSRELVEAKDAVVSGDTRRLADVISAMGALIGFYPQHIEKEDKRFFPDTERHYSLENS